MPEAELKAVVRRWFDEVLNQGNVEATDKYVAENLLDHTPFPGVEPSCEGFKQGLSRLRKAFPDGFWSIDDMIAEGDKVVVRNTFKGTHQGDYQGIAPTGNCVAVAGVDILRLSDGKIIEHWGYYDETGMAQQLGIQEKELVAASR